MTGGSLALSATGPSGPTADWRARLGLDGTVWTTPGALIEKCRLWQPLSAAIVSRSAGEAYWRSDQYRIGLPLTDVEQVTVQIDGRRAHDVKAKIPRSMTFEPAGVGIRIGIKQSSFVQIVQSPETYRDLAFESVTPVDLDGLEPIVGFDDPDIARLIEAIAREIDGGFLDHVLVSSLNTALAVQIARRFHGSAMQLLPRGRLSRARLKRVLDYIEAHLEDSLSVTEMAAIACLSPFHFSRCFKHSMGLGLHSYVVKRRIERAQRLVLQTDLTLTDIAAAAGFDSQSSFTARFRREVGVSPGRLRRERA
jgi:AraC-like DNA-binding protein